MVNLIPPPETPESVRKVLELLNRDLIEQFQDLNTHEQAQLWEQLHGYVLLHTKEKGRRTPLVAADHVGVSVRRALELIDGRITEHLAGLEQERQQRFWSILHQHCEQQLAASREASGRRLGGGSAS